MMRKTRRPSRRESAVTVAGILSAILITLPSVAAGEITIDRGNGAVFDGLVDGFPGLVPFDGIADVGGNALAAALQQGVTEERGIGEFPLSPLRNMCVDASIVRGALLHFNIDDVLSTFGPGTGFDGTAAEALLVHAYSGDGQVSLSDFAKVQAAPKIVDTRVYGTITDGTLAGSGPLPFDVDVTQEVRNLLVAAAGHLGIVWRTTDTPTGTSLDDLGINSAGPPGVGGARMPFLTVEVGGHPADLRCEGSDTVCTWEPEPGDVSFDVIRGDIASLAADEQQVDLGTVICILDDSPDATTVGHSDSDIPLPGQAFFYLMRAYDGIRNGTYGTSSACLARVALFGDCS